MKNSDSQKKPTSQRSTSSTIESSVEDTGSFESPILHQYQNNFGNGKLQSLVNGEPLTPPPENSPGSEVHSSAARAIVRRKRAFCEVFWPSGEVRHLAGARFGGILCRTATNSARRNNRALAAAGNPPQRDPSGRSTRWAPSARDHTASCTLFSSVRKTVS